MKNGGNYCLTISKILENQSVFESILRPSFALPILQQLSGGFK